MKTWLLPALFVCAAAGQARAMGFEGIVEYKMSEQGGEMRKMQYLVMGDRIRIFTEIAGKESASVLIDSEKRVMWTFNPGQKTALKKTLPDTRTSEPKRKIQKQPEFALTGRRDIVAGRECEIYSFSDASNEGQVCYIEGIGAFVLPGSHVTSLWEKEAMEKRFFPLKVTNKNINSGRTTMIEATRVEKRSLDPSNFTIPEEYKVIEGAFDAEPYRKRMMNASPEERKKIAEEMRKAAGLGQ